jgi:hypothetical protein
VDKFLHRLHHERLHQLGIKCGDCRPLQRMA